MKESLSPSEYIKEVSECPEKTVPTDETISESNVFIVCPSIIVFQKFTINVEECRSFCILNKSKVNKLF